MEVSSPGEAIEMRCWIVMMLLVSTVGLVSAQVQLETDAVDKDYSHELVRSDPKAPQEALDTLRVKEGFRVELVAAEPLVADPVAIAFDAHGRMYVVEMRGYSEQPEQLLGRVRRLQDTDHDGVYDAATNFLTGLSWPTAIACYDEGIFLGHPPHLQYCKDLDGDGVADVVDTWATGFGRQNVQGMMNSFVWGLDGRLYGSTSSNGAALSGPLITDPPLQLPRRDFALRFAHPIALQAVSGGGQHGQSFDAHGERFVSSNSNHLQWVEYEQRYINRNPYLKPTPAARNIAEDGPAAEVYRTSPVEPWREVRTRLRVKGMVRGPVEGGGRAAGYFTGATGVTIYRGDALTSRLGQGTHAFVGDVGGNLVHHKQIDTEVLEKTARRVEQASEFLTAPDNWFRPCQFANGPDGALYVVDMYRETIEHPLSLPPMIKRHLDLTSGRDRGRIYRVVPDNYRRSHRPQPGEVSDEALVAMLAHPNGWHRETAMHRILARLRQRDGDSERLLARLKRDTQHLEDPQGVVRGLYCLDHANALDIGQLHRGLQHPNSLVRIHATRLAERYLDDPSMVAHIQQMANDEQLAVRYQVALSLGEADVNDRVEALNAIALRDSDREKMRYALLSSINQAWSRMALELLPESAAASQPGLITLTEEVLRQVGASGQDLDHVVRTILRVPEGLRSRWLASVFAGTGRRGAELVQFLGKEGMEDAAGVVSGMLEDAMVVAAEEGTAVDARIAAVHRLALADFAEIAPVLEQLLVPRQPGGLRAAATQVTAAFSQQAAGKLLLEVAPSLPPHERRRVLELACQRQTWAELLLAQLAEGSLRVEELDAQHRLRLLNHGVAEIAQKAQQLIGPTASRSEVLERYESVLSRSGSVASGEAIFRRICATCHQLHGKGHAVGPDLEPLRNRGAAFFLTNILDPNREVDVRYYAYSILDDDGMETTGMISDETEDSVALRGADGKLTVIRRQAIEAMRSAGKSLMPEGFEKDLDPQALADLIAYLIAP